MPNQYVDESLLRPCGTAAAARRHWRRGEPLDELCLQAARRDRGSTGRQAPDRRARRNGLPAFRPYVYRGTGRDIYEGDGGG